MAYPSVETFDDLLAWFPNGVIAATSAEKGAMFYRGHDGSR